MMPVEHPLVRRHIVHAVVVPLGRRRTRIVQLQHALGDVFAVEAVGDEIYAEGGCHEPHGVDGLAATERQRGKGKGADDGHHRPQ